MKEVSCALLFLFLVSCMPHSQEYREFYRYYSERKPAEMMKESNSFIVFIVEARHLDYSGPLPLLRTMAKHPSDGSKNSDVGHAWIYLKHGETTVEGGHTAEMGCRQPRYLEGVSLLAERGDPNPARYLFCRQADGCFEVGSGGHSPTYAAKVDLSCEQAEQILAFIEHYPYEEYRLCGNSCASFVCEIARLANLELECRVTVSLDPVVSFRGETITLWRDPCYSKIEVASPDRLERSLVEAVESHLAEYALNWIRRQRKECFRCRTKRTLRDLSLIPKRALNAF